MPIKSKIIIGAVAIAMLSACGSKEPEYKDAEGNAIDPKRAEVLKLVAANQQARANEGLNEKLFRARQEKLLRDQRNGRELTESEKAVLRSDGPQTEEKWKEEAEFRAQMQRDRKARMLEAVAKAKQSAQR